MANEVYQAGDKVKVLTGAHQVPDTDGNPTGLDAVVVRRMTDADDYEVAYTVEQPGVSPIVHPDRMVLAHPRTDAEKAQIAAAQAKQDKADDAAQAKADAAQADAPKPTPAASESATGASKGTDA